jgi:hypothetical protein
MAIQPCRLPNVLPLVACSLVLAAASTRAEEDWQPLFNGKDLSGWVNVNVAPDTFTAREGMIVSTGQPTGTIRTQRMYENFVLELEWRHMKPQGNAGVFIWADPLTAVGTPFSRGIEVQVLDGRNSDVYTSHGDVFSIHGASMKPDRPHPRGSQRCLPSEHRCRPSPEWNHYRVTCNDGVIKLAVNGKEVSGGSECRPRKGYICLESEGSECHFRNLRIAELPSTNPSPEETANEAKAFVALLTRPGLADWKLASGASRSNLAERWSVSDWRLRYQGAEGEASARENVLWTAKEYGDFELVVDWRLTGKPVKRQHPVVLASGDDKRDESGQRVLVEVDDGGSGAILLRGSEQAAISISCAPGGSGEITAVRSNQKLAPDIRSAAVPKERADMPLGQWNRFVIQVKGDRATVDLNGKRIIEGASVPGIAGKGPIGLAQLGASVELANVFVRELGQ